MKPKLVLVVGPTAVGKSELAVEIASRLNGEIVNADSQQVYRGMDIGTGKPSPQVRNKVPHHLLDVIDPDEEFNVAAFRSMAVDAIEAIRSRGKKIVVCGGTGLYLKVLASGLFVGPGRDPRIRQRLEAEIVASSLATLYERLKKLDSAAASRVHPNDRQRIIRALEVYESTGKPISEWQSDHGFKESLFETLKIGLTRARAELYDLIDRRCERMVDDGLLDEVRGLIDKGYRLDLKPLRSVGYRHMGWVLEGAMRPEDALVVMKRDTRHLAKRQLTWFGNDEQIHWFHSESQKEEVMDAVRRYWS